MGRSFRCVSEADLGGRRTGTRSHPRLGPSLPPGAQPGPSAVPTPRGERCPLRPRGRLSVPGNTDTPPPLITPSSKRQTPRAAAEPRHPWGDTGDGGDTDRSGKVPVSRGGGHHAAAGQRAVEHAAAAGG